MNENEICQDAGQLAKTTCRVFLMIICVWTVAWMIKIHLDSVQTWFHTSKGGFIYWTLAKLIVWIFPAKWLIRISGRRLQQVFNLSNLRQSVLWGGGLGFLIALQGFVPNYLQGRPLLPTQFNFALGNVLVISPLFEEFLMRGAILGNLRQHHSFLTSNIISSFMFVGLHIYTRMVFYGKSS
jgi:membrane protease YdiL (CAAX protease family)